MRAYVCNSVGSKSKAAWVQTRKQLYVMRGQMTAHEQQALLSTLVRLTMKTELCANREREAYI